MIRKCRFIEPAFSFVRFQILMKQNQSECLLHPGKFWSLNLVKFNFLLEQGARINGSIHHFQIHAHIQQPQNG